jgi:hypothetical protein
VKSLAVVVSPGGRHFHGVRDHLADWTAAGFLSPFVWVNEEQVSDHGTAALLIERNGMRPIQLQAFVSAQTVDELSLCVLVPVSSSSTPITAGRESDVWQVLSNAKNSASVVPIRCIIVRTEDATRVDVGRPGWHNVVVSPESSTDPTRGISPLPPTTDPDDIGRHGAVGVAGLCGLWSGSPGSPLRDLSAVNDRYARLARCNLAWADGTRMHEQINDRVLDTGHLPRPTVALGTTAFVDDWETAVDRAARQLLMAHRDEFLGAREKLVEPPLAGKGILASIKMLGSFLWTAFLGAPEAWARKKLGELRSRVAESVQSGVFGQDSNYRVIMGLSQEEPAAISRVAQATTESLNRLAGNTFDASTTFPQLWADFVAGGLTLMDGGARSDAVTPVRVGTAITVVRSSDAVARAAKETLTVDARITGLQGVVSISASDVLGLERLRGIIEQARQEDPRNEYLAKMATQVSDFARDTGSTYAARTGHHLGALVLGLADEVQRLSQALAEAADQPASLVSVKEQRRLVNWMRILAVLLVVGVVVVIVLGGLGVISASMALGVGGAWVGSGILAMFLTFIQGQRNLFKALHRRHRAVEQADVNFRNLRHAMRDLRRASEAYGQFLMWSQVLAIFVHSPLGGPKPPEIDILTGLIGLPPNVLVGELRQRDARLEAIALEMRRKIFAISWLSGPWKDFLEDAARRIGPSAADLAGSPEAMFSERTDVEESLLVAWVEILQREGVGTVTGDDVRRSIRAELLSAEGRQAHLSDAEVIDAQGTSTSLADFVGGVGSDSAYSSRFDGRVLDAEARADFAMSRPDTVRVTPLPVVGLATARVEFSPEILAHHFTFDAGGSSFRYSPPTPSIPDWIV